MMSDDRQNAPFPFRLRPDLIWSSRQESAGRKWVAKDPVAQTFFEFDDREWRILQLLDGRRTANEVLRRIARLFPDSPIDAKELTGFLMQLSGSGVVLLDRLGQHRRRGGLRWLAAILSPLCIRLPGIDPRWLLNRLRPIGRLLFHRVSGCLAGLLLLSAIWLVLSRFDEVVERIPSWQSYLQSQQVVLLLTAFIAVKVMHELAHGLACHHFGGQCRELGVMFLAFMPCLYCDVSDAWLLTNRWKRILIAAAGMYVELILASLAVIVWYTSYPGILNSLAWNTVMVCSIGTLLVNANPLLRYDGYYILADYLGIPNMGQEARTAVWSRWESWLAGKEGPPSAPQPLKVFLVVYGILSLIYRLFIVTAISWGIYQATNRTSFELIGRVIIGLVMTGLLLALAVQLGRWWKLFQKSFRPAPLVFLAVLVGGIIVLVFFVPLPHWVSGPGIAVVADAQKVYSPHSGQVQWTVGEQAQVKSGDLICRLHNVDKVRQLARLQAQQNRLQLRLRGLDARALDDPDARKNIPTTKTSLQDIAGQLRLLRKELAELEVRSPANGVVMARPWKSVSHRRRLTTWTGSPLEDRNRGCFLAEGEFICVVGQPTNIRTEVVLLQDQIPQVQIGAKATLRFDQLPGQSFTGTISQVAQDRLENIPIQLQSDSTLPSRRAGQAKAVPLEPMYKIIIELNDSTSAPRLNKDCVVRARIHTGPKTIAWRISRFIASTFRFSR